MTRVVLNQTARDGAADMTALERAREVPSGSRVIPWAEIEAEAFASEPKIAKIVAPMGYFRNKPGAATGSLAKLGKVFLVLGIVVLAIVYYLPSSIGVALLAGDRFGRTHLDPGVSVPWGGAVFAAAFVFLLIDGIRWVRAGRKKNVLSESKAFAALLCSVPALVLAITQGNEADVPGWQAWAAVIAAVVALSAVLTVMTLAAHRADSVAKSKRRIRGEEVKDYDDDGLPVAPNNRVAGLLAAVPEEKKAAIAADIRAAIDDLESRHVGDAEMIRLARGAQLGALALRMEDWQERLAMGDGTKPYDATAQGTR